MKKVNDFRQKVFHHNNIGRVKNVVKKTMDVFNKKLPNGSSLHRLANLLDLIKRVRRLRRLLPKLSS